MRIVPLLLAMWVSFALAARGQDPPPPPPKEIPPVDRNALQVDCIDCGGAFTLKDHDKALKELLDGGAINNEMLAELRTAMYWQDTVHQFQSKAHFDNCAFDIAGAYVTELTETAGNRVAEAMQHRKAGREKEAREAAHAAFRALGQAMHAIQDFYAHSNYLEIQRDDGVALNAIPIVPVWTPGGRSMLIRLQADKHLHSGQVSWGLPKFCNSGESHHDMNKDSESSSRGGMHIENWQNITLNRAARQLAAKASLTYLKFVYRKWPYLPEVAGRRVVFDVFQDRRGL